jgi:hypothetical protein
MKLIIFLLAFFKKKPLKGLDIGKGKRNIYVCGYPISGNSWISYLIAYTLNCRYTDIDAKTWSEQREPLKKYLQGKNNHIGTNKFDCVLKTHALPSQIKSDSRDQFIYIVRDGRDVANSYFHRLEKWLPTSSYFRDKMVVILAKIIPVTIKYKWSVRYFSSLWAMHVGEALNTNVKWVRYEDFLNNPENCLMEVLEYIDYEVINVLVVRKAIEIFSFNNMKEKAKQGISNPKLRTDRKGVSGDWKNYYPEKENYRFICKHAKLLEALNYEK